MKKILVTGARRSGTTFSGRALSLHPSVSYLNEPFNWQFGIEGLVNEPSYLYIDKNNASKEQLSLLDDFFSLRRARYRYFPEGMDLTRLLPRISNIFRNYSHEKFPLRIFRVLQKNRGQYEFNKAKLFHGKKHMLVKDPLAALASEFLADRYGLKVVVVIRHPAAFFHSMKNKGWGYDSESFTRQEALKDRFPEIFEEDFLNARGIDDYIINEWIAVYAVLFNYLKAHPDKFLAVRHMDISLKPVETFKSLFRKLDFPYTQRIENRIIKLTSTSNKIEPTKMIDLTRNSSQLPFLWKEKLTSSEIDKIRTRTESLASQYFPAESWK
jgi:hypothetical protein